MKKRRECKSDCRECERERRDVSVHQTGERERERERERDET